MQFLLSRGKIIAYHDRSDGGLFVTLAEMAFAGHCGVNVAIDQLGVNDLAVLFNEELGAVIQVSNKDKETVLNVLSGHGLGNCCVTIGTVTDDDSIVITRNGEPVFSESRTALRSVWGETTYHMQALRDNPASAKSEFDAKSDSRDPGLSVSLTYDVNEDIAAPFIESGNAPKVAILREEIGRASCRERV